MREWRIWRTWRAPLSALAFGLLLGVMGPFGSSLLGPEVRYPFWMGLSLVGFGAAAAAERVLSPALSDRQTVTRIIAIAVASALPMTFFVAWAMGVVRPGRTFTPLQLLALFPYVALVQLLIARVIAPDAPATVATPVQEQSAPEDAGAAPQYPPEFMSKLPPDLRRDIIALEAEDHYVRVHTLHGSALVLMRLADAAALIDSRLGLRVHRSWWVAKDGVRGLEATSGRAVARLVDDRAVPISRTHLPAARDAFAN